VLFGIGRGELGGSEYLKVVHDLVRGMPPALDLEAERALQTLLVTLADEGLVRSAHDCSDGGLAVTIAECCFDTAGMGAEISIDGVEAARDARMNVVAALFGESASRVVVSVVPDQLTAVLQRAAAAKVPARAIGQTGGNRLRMAVGGASVIDQSVDEAERMWSTAIDRHFAKRVA
jgi:phosphoribosylformylglycinamidine synthase